MTLVIPDGLDVGIRDLVVYLIGAGFYTTDSGDGSKVGKVEGALPFKHVFIRVMSGVLQERANDLLNEARRFGLTVGECGTAPWYIQATYDPCADNYAVLMLAENPDYDPEDINFRKTPAQTPSHRLVGAKPGEGVVMPCHECHGAGCRGCIGASCMVMARTARRYQ